MTIDRKTAARTLREIATLLEVRGDNPHRIRAFANASRTVERLDGDLGAMAASGELLEVPGIGKGTVAVIVELASGRRPAVLEASEREVPEGVREIMEIPGLGPKKVRSLWRDLGVTSLGELEYACRENRLVELPGFGAATQERVLEGIRFRRQAGERRLLSEAWEVASTAEAALRGAPGIVDVVAVGDLRRMSETVAVCELLVTAAGVKAAERALGDRIGGLRQDGRDGFAGLAGDGRALRVRVAREPDAAAALVWSTGSERHLEALAARAESLGMRFDEQGLWRGDQRVSCVDEPSIYASLGCQWVPPELREDGGEVELAAAGSLPELVQRGDLSGALHNHTLDSDGAASVADMARAAGSLGWSFIGIADHSPVASYANGVTADRLRDQWRRIDAHNAAGDGPRVIKGLEADILGDGSLDVPEGCGEGLEYVVASVHSGFRLSEAEQTERVVRAVSHPLCRVLGHPTGRLLLARPGFAIDLEEVFAACAEHGVAVEINASPYRLDLDWRWARRAVELGIRLIVNPDAHSTDGLADVRWGLAVARKAGATKDDLVNCAPIDDFLNQR